jgi:hypothetical protein
MFQNAYMHECEINMKELCVGFRHEDFSAKYYHAKQRCMLVPEKLLGNNCSLLYYELILIFHVKKILYDSTTLSCSQVWIFHLFFILSY